MLDAGGEQDALMVLRQDSSSTESRAVGQACMLLDIATRVCRFEALHEYTGQLRDGRALPVGSVEYMLEAMRIAGIAEPAGLSYPECLDWLMRRRWRRCAKAEVLPGEFTKPVATKVFTGFVLPRESAVGQLDEHDQEQYKAFVRLSDSEPVYACEQVQWLCEWRIYVAGGVELGRARYDPLGLDTAPQPDESDVSRALACMRAWLGSGATYGLDMGVMSCGTTAVVEVNDAFALGLYGGALSSKLYLNMLWARWRQLLNSSEYAAAHEVGFRV